MELAGTFNLSIIFSDLTESLDFIVLNLFGHANTSPIISPCCFLDEFVLEIVHWFLTSIYADLPVLLRWSINFLLEFILHQLLRQWHLVLDWVLIQDFCLMSSQIVGEHLGR